jgi:oxygen-independent coproporphyrinogen-3 oxidase
MVREGGAHHAARDNASVGHVRHLYVHVPFCAHRCGYCDFVTVTGREAAYAPYVDALLRELAARGDVLADRLETVYLGGGTPSLLGPPLLARLLDALPPATLERTVEVNPETVDDALAEVLAARGCRVSLGAQSLDAGLLATLERRATPEAVRGAVAALRGAGVANLSLDLIHGVPGETLDVLRRDLDGLLALEPDHLSCYELEAKPGTRFAHRHGRALAAQAEALEGQLDLVIDRLQAAGYRWYETASFARPGREARHNTAYWLGRDYLGLGVGAVSTVAGVRRVNGPRLAPYLAAAGGPADVLHRLEPLDAHTRLVERLMLGLRLADGVARADVAPVLDGREERRLATAGLLVSGADRIRLTRRGRLLAHDVTARLLRDDADEPAPRTA